MSPGNAFSCNFPSFTSRRFLCSCAKSPPLYLSGSVTQPGSPPECVDGAFRMWFLRKCLSVVGVGSSQRLKTAGGLLCQLCVHRASPPLEELMPQCAGAHPALTPCHRSPCLRDVTLTMLVLRLLNGVSSQQDLSLG